MEAKLRILAVDDNTINLATIEQELKNNYEVITVNSGVRALRYLNTEIPDLILLDIQMALKDGIETLKEIRAMENGAEIPVIMLTAKQDRETIIECSKLGAYDYILKPFKGQDLQDRIIRTLKRAGVIAVDQNEIYEKVREVEEEIESKNIKGAISKLDEILRYKIDGEISGRLQNARTRLRSDETESALRLVVRVRQMLERSGYDEGGKRQTISEREITSQLNRVLADLEDFKVHEAAEKLEELKQFNLPADIEKFCNKALAHLEEYDDGAAEEIIRDILSGS